MKYFIPLLVTLIIVSCEENINTMNLSGQVKGLKKGTLVLQKIEDTLLVSIDSTEIYGDAYFNLSDLVESPELYYLYLRLNDGTLLDDRVSFFAEPGEIIINTSLDNFSVDAVVTGSDNEDKLNDYRKLMSRYSNKYLDLVEQELLAKQSGNDSLYLEIKNKQESTIKGKYLATVNYALNNKDYEVAPFLMLSEAHNVNLTYLDTVYNVLTPKIKDSKYGQALESYIKEREELNN